MLKGPLCEVLTFRYFAERRTHLDQCAGDAALTEIDREPYPNRPATYYDNLIVIFHLYWLALQCTRNWSAP